MNLTIKVDHVATRRLDTHEFGKGGGSWEGGWKDPNEVKVSEETAVMI